MYSALDPKQADKHDVLVARADEEMPMSLITIISRTTTDASFSLSSSFWLLKTH